MSTGSDEDQSSCRGGHGVGRGEVPRHREGEEGDLVRAAEVAAAARKSHEAGAAVQRAKRVLAKPGDKHRRSGRVLAATAAMAPYCSSFPAIPDAGTPYKAPGPYPAAVATETPAQALEPYPVAQPTPRPSLTSALPAEGAPAADTGNHPAAAAIKFLGAPPADAVGAPPAAAVAHPATVTPTISKDGVFLDSTVHCMQQWTEARISARIERARSWQQSR